MLNLLNVGSACMLNVCQMSICDTYCEKQVVPCMLRGTTKYLCAPLNYCKAQRALFNRLFV